jgi:hypothetical protein
MNNIEEIIDQSQEVIHKQKAKMNTKDELILNIKEWIKMDNEITKLKTEVKDKTNKKKELTESLVSIMKNNSIDCFDINGGALVYKKRKTKKTISGKFLLAQLAVKTTTGALGGLLSAGKAGVAEGAAVAAGPIIAGVLAAVAVAATAVSSDKIAEYKKTMSEEFDKSENKASSYAQNISGTFIGLLNTISGGMFGDTGMAIQFANSLDGIENKLDEFIPGLGATAMKALSFVSNILTGAGDLISGLLTGNTDKILLGLGELFNGILNGIGVFWNGFVTVTLGAFKIVFNAVLSVFKLVTKLWGGGDMIDEASKSINDAFTTIGKKMTTQGDMLDLTNLRKNVANQAQISKQSNEVTKKPSEDLKNIVNTNNETKSTIEQTKESLNETKSAIVDQTNSIKDLTVNTDKVKVNLDTLEKNLLTGINSIKATVQNVNVQVAVAVELNVTDLEKAIVKQNSSLIKKAVSIIENNLPSNPSLDEKKGADGGRIAGKAFG